MFVFEIAVQIKVYTLKVERRVFSYNFRIENSQKTQPEAGELNWIGHGLSLGPKIMINCPSFIKIDTDILEEYRIARRCAGWFPYPIDTFHPDAYDWFFY